MNLPYKLISNKNSCHDSYLPPEFFMHGIVDEKTDVYAFGVMLLELITGRQAVDSSQQSLVMWVGFIDHMSSILFEYSNIPFNFFIQAKPLIKANKIKEIVDPTLGDAYDCDELNRLIGTASVCIHQSAVNRPQMSQACPIVTCNPSKTNNPRPRYRMLNFK